MDEEKRPCGPGPSDLQEDPEEPIIISTTTSDLKGYHPRTGIKEEITSQVKKVKLYPCMNPNLSSEENKAKLKEVWQKGNSFRSDEVEIIVDPFRVCVIDNFLESPDYIDGIRSDFNVLDWNKRKMDLYEFFQSKDLKTLDLDYIKGFYELLKKSVMTWVAEITGYPLEEISATCSCYTNTDYLLVHDDQREDRMVAFVYYMTSSNGWDSSKGGSLDLLSKDEKGLPEKVVRSILPKNNQLVFFPVTNDSYHQVAEVTTLEDTRLTINGWFHVRTPPVFQSPHFEYPVSSLFGKRELKPVEKDLLLESWIEESYLNNEDGTLEDIQKHIEENSEISLREFFRKEALDEIEQCLEIIEENGEKWKRAAPPNRSLYDVLVTDDSLPHSLKRFLDLFQSQQFFDYLKIITDVKFSSMKFEFQRWFPGSYCLLSDYNWSKEELDVIFYIPSGEVEGIVGGRTQYVSIDEEIQEALITIEPLKNRMNLVYRDTARFTSYFSKQSRCEKFYLLICTFSE
ncbi:prolyl 3-hydroxylase sudestada1 [Coccinella septempunctata]|uniref:prolyl 3-hydroxylase sudestada1 n=1 Tax=Coccinella septempunctata TaxID=41139 RepID=UPI001D06B747|nr:prolyl 3-hydroxylase sudestada1 [Coccinella septempunctata]